MNDKAHVERVLRVLVIAQLRLWQAELARMRLRKAMKRSEQLKADRFVAATRLRAAIVSLALEARAAGHSPVQMVVLLREMIKEAGIERRFRPEIEPDVVRWGVETFFAA